jgi:hypothetical protein
VEKVTPYPGRSLRESERGGGTKCLGTSRAQRTGRCQMLEEIKGNETKKLLWGEVWSADTSEEWLQWLQGRNMVATR